MEALEGGRCSPRRFDLPPNLDGLIHLLQRATLMGTTYKGQ